MSRFLEAPTLYDAMQYVPRVSRENVGDRVDAGVRTLVRDALEEYASMHSVAAPFIRGTKTVAAAADPIVEKADHYAVIHLPEISRWSTEFDPDRDIYTAEAAQARDELASILPLPEYASGTIDAGKTLRAFAWMHRHRIIPGIAAPVGGLLLGGLVGNAVPAPADGTSYALLGAAMGLLVVASGVCLPSIALYHHSPYIRVTKPTKEFMERAASLDHMLAQYRNS